MSCESGAILPHKSTIDYILLKLAARCNINCSYCYWFRDETVYEKPRVLTPEAEEALLAKLESHIRKYEVKSFFILFHGGEPLLFGKPRFAQLCRKLRRLEQDLGFKLRLSVTTNGTLIDQEFAELISRYRVGVTLSVDGPQEVHDTNRVDFQGRGTFARTMAALSLLRNAGVEPAILAVCHPDQDPRDTCEFFLNELQANWFDILVPDATHEDPPPSIAAYYKKLFDLWYDTYSPKGVQIRFLESLVKGLVGIESRSESIGYGPIMTTTMHTDGSLEALDVLRIADHGITRSNHNILTHELQDVQQDPFWLEVWQASLHLHPTCESCVYRFPCGGGHLASRWSKASRFHNPSVYCEDFKQIFQHVWSRIAPDMYVYTPEASFPILSAAEDLQAKEVAGA